jgi:hypothetical protein
MKMVCARVGALLAGFALDPVGWLRRLGSVLVKANNRCYNESA